MNVFIAQRYVSNALKIIGPSEVIFQTNDIIVSSENNPKVYAKGIKGRRLIIWGQIYAAINGNGGIERLGNSNDTGSKLMELFDKFSVEKVVCQIEGRFLGILIGDDNGLTVFGDSLNRMDLFYYKSEHGLIASSDLKTIMQCKDGPLTYDQSSLACMFNISSMYAPKKHTIYKEICRLGVGERIEYRQGKIEIKCLSFGPIPIRDYGDHELNEYSELMHSAVEIRSSTEYNWVYLSSGWDSSAILALLTKLYGPSKVRALIFRGAYSKSTGIINQFEVDRAKSNG